MAQLVLTNAYLAINGVNVSSSVRSLTLDYSAELVDDTVMGDTTRSRAGGLKDWTLTAELVQDYVDDGLDEDIFALVGTTTTIAVRPVNTTISVNNPEFAGTGIIESYQPVQGAVGELAVFTLTVRAAGALTRDVTP